MISCIKTSSHKSVSTHSNRASTTTLYWSYYQIIMIETWQIGKRLKKVIDENPDMEKSQMMDALFLWGTALARLASQHDDVELANAAIDKFEEIDRISNKEANALGAVGYTLWGSCLLVLAKEQQDNTLFSKAFEALDVKYMTDFTFSISHVLPL